MAPLLINSVRPTNWCHKGFRRLVPFIEATLGLIVLLVSADFLVRGAIAVAQRFGVSALMIGLTVVAFGTSAPEFVTSLAAAMRGLPGMAAGNIVGSNIANSLLIVGAAAVIRPIMCSARAVSRDAMVMVAATLLFIGLALVGGILRWHGAILLVALFTYLGWSYRAEIRLRPDANPMEQEVKNIQGVPTKLWMALATLLAAMLGLVVGSRLLVDGGVAIATIFEVPDAVIGLTLIAFGTSLPELATVIIAALRRHGDVAIGNIVGSNIFNLLAIGGGVSVLEGMRIPTQIVRFDLWALLAATGLLVLMLARSHRIARIKGGIFMVAYIAYIGAQYGPLRHVFRLE